MLKGVAIQLMLFHHFFGAYHVDSDVTRPARGEWAFTAMADFAWEAKVCVALFAFVTGYGYFATAGRDAGGTLMSGVRRLRRFYPFFVAFCLLHIVLCFCFPFHHQLDIAHIPHYLLTMVGLLSAAPDYWYICIVIMGALLFYPLLLSAQRRGDKLHMIAFVGLALLTVPKISNGVCTLILNCFVEDAEDVFNYIHSFAVSVSCSVALDVLFLGRMGCGGGKSAFLPFIRSSVDHFCYPSFHQYVSISVLDRQLLLSSSPCLHITTSAGAVGAAADIVGELLGLHVAESPFDIRILVRRMVLRFADTAELWAVGRAFFPALCPDNESMEQRVAMFGAARVGGVPSSTTPGRANFAVRPLPSKARTMV